MLAKDCWINTFSGKKFLLLGKHEIDLQDIAHSLSFQCRFNGHCLRFYSVAQHCINVARILPQELKLWGLLHDAAEAYIGDMPRPIKKELGFYNNVETSILLSIAGKFNLEWPMPDEIKKADDKMLATEERHIMNSVGHWNLREKPLRNIDLELLFGQKDPADIKDMYTKMVLNFNTLKRVGFNV